MYPDLEKELAIFERRTPKSAEVQPQQVTSFWSYELWMFGWTLFLSHWQRVSFLRMDVAERYTRFKFMLRLFR